MNDFKLKHGYFRYYITVKPSVFSSFSEYHPSRGSGGSALLLTSMLEFRFPPQPPLTLGVREDPCYWTWWEFSSACGLHWCSLAGMCSTPSYYPDIVSTDTGQGWQGKLYYHQVEMKLPVPYSAFSSIALQGTWGACSQSGKGGSLGSMLCLCWYRWDRGLFCSVWLECSSYCFLSC